MEEQPSERHPSGGKDDAPDVRNDAVETDEATDRDTSADRSGHQC